VRKVSNKQIDIEAKSGYKPWTVDTGVSLLPFSELGDREFELLCYLLVQEEIEAGKYSNITSISLMQGVSERGRDCSLYNQGTVCGLIQCKKYIGRISRPQTLREIIKFLLFSLLDSDLLPVPEHFEYMLYVSNDFAETTNSLIHSYATEIEKDISSGSIARYTKDVVEEYESFKRFIGAEPVTEITSLLRKIKLSAVNATALTSRVHKNESLLSLFFNVKTVIDLESADEIVRNALDDYGLRYLTDEDLKKLQSRISETKEENRINLGFVDFFGYNKEFFKYLNGEPFKKVIEAVASVTSILDKYLMEFISSKIHQLTLEKVTEGLLNCNKIHPFSVGVVQPYLFKRLTSIVMAKKLPKSLVAEFSFNNTQSKSELIQSISNQLFDSSERVMNGDLNHLAGSPEDIEFKKIIYERIHSGFKNIEDAKVKFNSDLKVLVPILDQIEQSIDELLQEERTVVIKDASFFDDESEMKKLAHTLHMIDPK